MQCIELRQGCRWRRRFLMDTVLVLRQRSKYRAHREVAQFDRTQGPLEELNKMQGQHETFAVYLRDSSR